MLISIVIPVFNVEIFISECLQSVIRQTYTGPLECIVVDDCGTDKSIEIAEQLIAEYDGPIDFKVLHHDHNRGLSAARNTGMDAAKGDYVYFLDSDDWISDDCIEKLAKPLQNEVFDVVVGNQIWDIRMRPQQLLRPFLKALHAQRAGQRVYLHHLAQLFLVRAADGSPLLNAQHGQNPKQRYAQQNDQAIFVNIVRKIVAVQPP